MNTLGFPSYRQAQALARQGNLVPLVARLPADLETPVGVFMKLRSKSRPAFLLESVEGGVQSARYSFIGTDPVAEFSGSEEAYELRTRSGRRSWHGDPYELIRRLVSAIQPVAVPGLPRFSGGAVGVFGYDVARRRERIPAARSNGTPLPEVWLGWYDTIFAFDHVSHQLLVVAHWDTGRRGRRGYEEAIERASLQVGRLSRRPRVNGTAQCGTARSNLTRSGFELAVRSALEHIGAGDIFQVVLSQRFSAPFTGDPFQVYRRLRRINPSPYLFYLDCGGFQVAGSSPETLVRVEGRTMTLCPIAGTRPRGSDLLHDARLDPLARQLPDWVPSKWGQIGVVRAFAA